MNTENAEWESKYNTIPSDLSTIKVKYLTTRINRIHESGVYLIYNIVNHKIYIGSTNSFRDRKEGHFYLLSKDDHGNIHLQRAYEKYGVNSFAFLVLEYCPEDKLIEREQYYLDLHKSYEKDIGYNISKIAGKNCLDGVEFKVFSPEGKFIIGRNMAQFCRENGLITSSFEKSRRKGSRMVCGGWRVFKPGVHPERDLTPEEMEKFKLEDRKAQSAKFRVVYRFLVNNQEVVIDDLREYAEKMKLDRMALINTWRQNNCPYKGHVSLKNAEITQRQLNWKGNRLHILICKDGSLLKVYSLREFCRENCLNRRSLTLFSISNRFYKDYFLLKGNIHEEEFNEAEIKSLYIEKLKLLQKDCN